MVEQTSHEQQLPEETRKVFDYVREKFYAEYLEGLKGKFESSLSCLIFISPTCRICAHSIFVTTFRRGVANKPQPVQADGPLGELYARSERRGN